MGAYDNDPRVKQSGPNAWLIIPEPDRQVDDEQAVEVRRQGDVFVVDWHGDQPDTEHETADEAIRSVLGDPL